MKRKKEAGLEEMVSEIDDALSRGSNIELGSHACDILVLRSLREIMARLLRMREQ
jgi:hypothetical protein